MALRAGKDDKMTPINKDLLTTRFFDSVSMVGDAMKLLISGVKPGGFYSPGQPQKAVAPETKGRVWDFPVGINMGFNSDRGRGALRENFALLRAMAEELPLLRVGIERRKDQMKRMSFNIKDNSFEEEGDSPDAAAAKAVFKYPDGILPFETWQGKLLEDMFVIDAACIEPRRLIQEDGRGEIVDLDVVDGATIWKAIDDFGRTPTGKDDVAYQQVLKGLPANDLKLRDLLYMAKNLRSNKLYGYSVVEQIEMIVNQALRRELHKLEFYTEGTEVDEWMIAPKEWTTSDLKEFKKFWDAMHEGNTAERRKLQIVAGGTTFHNPKERILKDEFDEWLARVVMFALGLSPAGFIKTVNRSTQEVSKGEEDEALESIKKWFKAYMDMILQSPLYMNKPHLEWEWMDKPVVDRQKRAIADQTEIRNGMKSVDDARKERGQSKLGMGAVMVLGPNIYAIEDLAAAQGGGEQAQPLNASPSLSGSAPSPFENLEKQAKKKILTLNFDPTTDLDIKAVESFLAEFLIGQAAVITAQLAPNFPEVATAKLEKADGNVAAADQMIADLDFDGWAVIQGDLEGFLLTEAKRAGASMVQQMELSTSASKDLLIQVDQASVEFAKKRSAEMIGKKFVKGKLVNNPNATFAITAKTRKLIRKDIINALENGESVGQLGTRLADNYSFSAQRGRAIAITELSNASGTTGMEAWKLSGVVQSKQWLLSGNHVVPDGCDENAQAGAIPLDADFPSGHKHNPAHTGCWCDTVAIVSEGFF